MSVEEEIKSGMRRFLATRGQKVEFREDWDGKPQVSTFGWTDYDASHHINEGCHWIVPEGATVKEETYSQFQGTFTSNTEEVGINVAGVSCACGKYKNVTIRATSSLGDAIQALLGYDPTRQMTL